MTGWSEPRDKPRELLALRATAARLFQLTRAEFGVPDTFALKLRSVDESPQDTARLAALAMEGSQTLRRVATSGVEITGEDAIVACFQLARTLDHLAAEATEPNCYEIMKIRDHLHDVGIMMWDLDEPQDGPHTTYL